MIKAVEQGRRLVITVGDGDDAIVVSVAPVNTKTGAAVFALWAGILFGQSEQPEVDAGNMSKIAVGEENWDIIEELRYAEGEKVINAAFFWQTQGGGIDVVNEMLGGGFPKARETLLKTNGLWEEFSLLQTLLSGASEPQTPSQDDSLATTTQPGTSGSSSTVDRLPAGKKSIHQNRD